MPFISDFGAMPNAEAVNQTGDRIRQAWQQGQARDAQEQEQNRLLHPATQKWLQKVMSGEMTAAQAAVAAHSEIDAQGFQSPDMQASGGKLGDATEQGMGAPQMPPPQSLREAATAPMPPMTVRDAGDFERLAPAAGALRPRSGTGVPESDMEARIRLKAELDDKALTKKEAGKGARLTQTLTSREVMAQKEIEFKAAKMVQDREVALQGIKAKLDIAMQRNATEREIAAIKIEASKILAADSANARMLGSLMEQTPDMDEAIRRNNANADQANAELRARVGTAIPDAGAGGPASGLTGGQSLVPEGPAQEMNQSTPDIPPVIPNLGIPPPLPNRTEVKEPPAAQYGPPAADLSALPPAKGGKTGKKASAPTGTGIFKTDKAGVKWEKMSDGSARRVN